MRGTASRCTRARTTVNATQSRSRAQSQSHSRKTAAARSPTPRLPSTCRRDSVRSALTRQRGVSCVPLHSGRLVGRIRPDRAVRGRVRPHESSNTAFARLASALVRKEADTHLRAALGRSLAVGASVSNVVPEAMLADIIDYDELISGERREGMYVILETSVMQLLEIVGNSIPQLLLASVGYKSNGGCSCGCGVACPVEYHRWNCPSDIGYACPGGEPLFGDPSRQPPCTVQPEGVRHVIGGFFNLAPCIFFLLATFVALYAPIDAKTHTEIIAATKRRRSGQAVTDPVSGRRLEPYPDEHRRKISQALKHYYDGEIRMLERHGVRALVLTGMAWALMWLVITVCVVVVSLTILHRDPSKVNGVFALGGIAVRAWVRTTSLLLPLPAPRCRSRRRAEPDTSGRATPWAQVTLLTLLLGWEFLRLKVTLAPDEMTPSLAGAHMARPTLPSTDCSLPATPRSIRQMR